ncbi:hypothetical protein ACP70R_034310 [Stipagrostis hirtigluma subsp. patula]
MGNCGLKPKTSGDDDAPPPAEPQTPAKATEGEPKDDEAAPAVEAASQDVMAPISEEATSATAETKERDEPKEEEGPKDGTDQGKQTQETAAEEAGELPASTPANVA